MRRANTRSNTAWPSCTSTSMKSTRPSAGAGCGRGKAATWPSLVVAPAIPRNSLAEVVRDRIEGAARRTPARARRYLLAHLRYAGYGFNPVAYYRWRCRGRAAQYRRRDHQHAVEGTPRLRAARWRARRRGGRALQRRFDKAFHVSPFLPLDRRYAWSFTLPLGDPQGAHGRVRRRQARVRCDPRAGAPPTGWAEPCARAVALSADDRAGDRRHPPRRCGCG